MINNAKNKIKKTVEKWYISSPLYFIVWLTHRVIENEHIKSIRTHSGVIEYNPIFIESLNHETLNEVLEFEVMRIVLKHPYKRKKSNKAISYFSSNLTIKEYSKSKLNFPNSSELFETNEYDRKYFEFYYNMLINNLSLCDKTESIGDIDEDNYLKFFSENTQHWDDDDFYSNIVNDKIENIRNTNNWGNIPNYAKERILATLKPKLNYRAILRNFKASIISSRRKLTRMKPNRRYGFDYMGSKYEYSSKLLFAVDVSGSMDHRTLMNGFSIISNIFNYGVEIIDVIEFDTEVKGKKREIKKAFKDITIAGRGGTAFQPVFDYVEKNDIYDGLIIFTDGYAPTPKWSKKVKAKVVWLFNNERNYNSIKDKLVGLGLSMYIKPE